MLLRLLLAALLSGLLLLPLGCGGDDGGGEEVERPEAEQRRIEVEGEGEVADEEGSVTRYSYNAVGKRDPFRSFISRMVIVEGEEGALGPLQLHEIDKYRLRGIIWNIGAPRGQPSKRKLNPHALVEDPDGIGHVVDIGTLIGKNWGKVTQIKPEEIVITEEYRDPIENELIINEITMRLPDPGAEEED